MCSDLRRALALCRSANRSRDAYRTVRDTPLGVVRSETYRSEACHYTLHSGLTGYEGQYSRRNTIHPRVAPAPLLHSTAALLLPQPSVDAAESCVLPANKGVTDGARTRDLRSHNSKDIVPVRTSASVEFADLQVNREIGTSTCPLRTGAQQPGCSTVAVHGWSSTRAPG